MQNPMNATNPTTHFGSAVPTTSPRLEAVSRPISRNGACRSFSHIEKPTQPSSSAMLSASRRATMFQSTGTISLPRG